MDKFTDKLTMLYDDFAQRIDESSWGNLINEELLLANHDDISDEILEFLMQKNNLPRAVWHQLEAIFAWELQKEELKNHFPPAFIEFVTQQSKADINEDIKFHLFEPNTNQDFDRFIWLIREVARYLDYRRLDDAESLIEELDGFGIDHPDYLLEKARIMAIEGDPDAGLDLLHYVFDNYTEDYLESNYFKFVHAFVLATFSNEPDKVEEAILFFEELLEINADQINVKDGLADCYEQIGDFKKAHQFTFDYILSDFPTDNYALQRIELLAGKLLPIYQQKYETGTATDEDILELAKYYRQTRQPDAAFELLNDNSQLDNSHKYHLMLASAHLVARDYEKARSHAEESILIKPSIFAYDSFIQVLVANRFFDEALEQIEEVKKLPAFGYERVAKASILGARARIFYRLRNYDEALIAIEEALNEHDKIAHLYDTKAEILMRLNQLQEAMNFAITSQNLFPYSLLAYEIQAEIYYLAYKNQGVIDVVQAAQQCQVPIVDKLAYYHALTLRDIAREENADLQPVLDLLLALEQRDSYLELNQFLVEEGLLAKLLSEIAYTYWYKEEDEQALNYILRALDEVNEFIEETVIANWIDFQGMVLEALNRHDEALAVCEAALTKFPASLPLLIRIGRLQSRNENFEKAAQSFVLAHELDVKNEVAYEWLEYCYRMLKQIDEALKISQKWIEETGSPRSYRCLAWNFRETEGLDKEYEILKNGLLIHQNNEQLLEDLGYHHEARHEFTAGITVWQDLLAVNPESTKARIGLAYCLTTQGEHDQALTLINQALEQNPDKVAYYARRALICLDMKEPEKAIIAYEAALKKIPLDNDSYWTEALINNRLGTIYSSKLNDGEKALVHYQKAVELHPEDEYFLECLASLYEKYEQNYEKALDFYRQSAALKETTYSNWFIGDMLTKLGNANEARAYYEKALNTHNIEPNSGHNDYTTQAELLIALDQLDEALKYLVRAEEIMKTDGHNSCGVCACVYRTYARFYMKKNQLDQSLASVERAIELENSIGGNALKQDILQQLKK